MKSLLRWGTTLGLIGTATLTTWLGAISQAIALPKEEVVEILRPVPIFAVLTPDNQPAPLCQADISQTGACPDDKLIFTFYIDPRDAENALNSQISSVTDENIKKQLSTFKVGPIPLSGVYTYLISNSDKNNVPKIAIIPNQEQLKVANTMSGQNDQAPPVFIICYQEEKNQCDQPIFGAQVLPVFFEKSVAEQFIEEVEKKNPGSSEKLRISSTNLFNVFAQLTDSQEPELKKLRFFLSESTDELLQKYLGNSNARQDPNS